MKRVHGLLCLAFWGWVLGPAAPHGSAQHPCPPGLAPEEVFFEEGLRDDFAQPGEETYRGPGFDRIPGPWADFDFLGANRRFGHTIRFLPAHVEGAVLRLRIQSRSSLSSNDTIGLELTGDASFFAWSGRIATLLGSPWNRIGEITTLRLDLSALPLPDGSTVDILPHLNRDHALDIYLQDDTTVDFITLEMDACTRDCNGDGVSDYVELRSFGGDCNGNGILDTCEEVSDCNGNGIPDSCELADGALTDCNGNGEPDSCELIYGTLTDCNCDGIADLCEPEADLDGNGRADLCENGPDEASDCNGNGIFDRCELIGDELADCNGNGILDRCEPGGVLMMVCPETTTRTVGAGCEVRIPLQPQVRGGCGEAVIAIEIEPSLTDIDGTPKLVFPPGVYTVSFTATDAGGNVATCSTLVVVEDVQPPVITPKEGEHD